MIKTLQSDWRAQGLRWLVPMLATVFGMQELRVLLVGFVGYLRDSQDVASLDLAPVALGIFALSFLAFVVNRGLGTRNALWLAVGGLAVVRVVEQVVSSAAIDLYLSEAGVVLFLIYVSLAIGAARARGGDASTQLGSAFLLGLSLDAALFIGFKTVDLSWLPGFLPLGIVLFFAGLLLWALQRTVDESAALDGNWTVNRGLMAIGPWMLLQVLIFQNVGLIGSLTGWEIPGAGLLLLSSNALALGFAGRLARRVRKFSNLLISGAVLIVVLLQSNAPGGLVSAIWVLIGQVISYGFVMAIFQRSGEERGAQGLLRTSLMFGFGQVIFVLLLFLYYASYDLALGVRPWMLPPAAAILIAALLMLGRVDRGTSETKPNASLAWSAGLLALVPLLLMLGWKSPSYESAPAGTNSVKVMDYNLHNAVNTDGRLDLEALALVIEAQNPDVLVLQEVSRGWLTWGAVDMLSWLEQRLDMAYVWGPTADAQWGNAIFSRYPVTSFELLTLPPDDILLARGHIQASIDVDGYALTVIATHFSAADNEGEARLVQASAILSTWNHQASTVVMGDLNAEPDEDPIRLLVENGLVDISAEIGDQPTYTYYSANPDHQIDYILVSPDLGYSDFAIPHSTASDHLPLVATIHLTR